MCSRTSALFLLAASLLIPVSVAAQVDHLQCHKIKDGQKFNDAQVTLDAIQSNYQMPADCEIIGKGKEFCVPVKKTVVTTDAPTGLVGAGQDLSQNDYVCYKMKCPKTTHADEQVTDQFGTRVLEKIKAPKRICVPAVKGPGCQPDCSVSECGDDGCGGSCGSCALDETCVNGVCEPDCTPTTELCNGLDDDCDGEVDEGCPALGSTQIQSARDSADGAVSIEIPYALVTYLRPAIGNDAAGFYLQAELNGPALLVGVDPNTLVPSPLVGDQINLFITEMGTEDGARVATAVTGVSVVSSGNPLSAIVQDVTASTDLTAALGNYESELLSADGVTIVSTFGFAGSGFVSAQVETPGISSDPLLLLRVPDALQTSLGLGVDCVLDVGPTPLVRFNSSAQLSAWVESEMTNVSCP